MKVDVPAKNLHFLGRKTPSLGPQDKLQGTGRTMAAAWAVRALLLAAVVAVAVAVPFVDPPPPVVMCNMTTAAECDAVPCCTWCGSPWSAAVR